MKSLLRICASILFLWLCAEGAVAQTSLFYSHPGFSYTGYEVIPLKDGGFMVGGQGDDTTTGNLQYWVTRFSKRGTVEWDSVYGGDTRDFLWSIQPSGDGGALLAGYTGVQFSGTETALLFKIDSLGHSVNRVDVHYSRAVHAHWFAHRKEGGYFWAGHTDSESDSTGEYILQKLDENMNKVWEKTYHLNSFEHAHCGTLTSDGGCVLAGHTVIGGLEHYWVVRVDSNGNERWSKVFQTSSSLDEAPYAVVTTREGGFAVFGSSGNTAGTSSTFWLVVVDSAGNKIVDKHFGTGYSFAFSGIQTSDGGFAMIGYTNALTAGGFDELVVRTDAKGVQKWQKRYGAATDEFGYAMFEHNAQYVLVGESDNGPNQMAQLYIQYIDSNGIAVPYDTTSRRLYFSLDSSRLEYTMGQTSTAHGWVRNLDADSAHFYYRHNDPVHAGDFVIQLSIGAYSSTADSSSTPIGIAANESLPVTLTVTPYEPVSDSASLSLALYPIGIEPALPIAQSVELHPSAVSGVALSVNPESADRLQIFPNPVTSDAGSIRIVAPHGAAMRKIDIFDMTGRVVRSFQATRSAFNLSLADAGTKSTPFRSGIYMVRVETALGSLESKFVVE